MNFADFGKKPSPPPGGAQPAVNTDQAVDESFDVSNNKGYSLALFICWMAAFVAIAGSVFFWLLNNSAKTAIKEKGQQKTSIISEIAVPSLADTEVKASTFKVAVAGLSSITTGRYPLNEFLPKFYEKIAQNIKINNISVSADGRVSLDGQAPSYRAVADQLLLFKGWKVNDANILKNIQLMNVSQTINEQTKKIEVAYSISLEVDKVKSLTEKPKTETTTEVTAETTTDDQGGEDATIQ